MWISLLLPGRVFLSASASALQKRLTLHGMSGAEIWRITYAWMSLPALVALAMAMRQPVHAGFWRDAALAGVIDALGNLAMLAALATTDLSVYGPLNGFRPVLAMAFGWAFLGERVSWNGGLGVGITVLGATLLLSSSKSVKTAAREAAWKSAGLRLLGLSLSTLASVFFKRALLTGSSGGTLGVWILCGLPVVWIGFRKAPPAPEEGAPANRGQGLLFAHAAIFFAMQWLTLEIFRTTLLAYSFALFQLGMVLQVLIGCWFFREGQMMRRLACCAIMGLGALLITGVILHEKAAAR
jgi:drug/metabolite transporter (DMT)-like permease